MPKPSFEEWLTTYTPMMGGDPEGDPVAAAPPAAPAAPEPPAAPWSADLAAAFEDPALRGQVDAFMREKYQPYVTELEQTRSQAEPALALVQDLQNDPVSTYIAITQELYGEDAANAVAATINQHLAPEPVPAAPAATPEPAPAAMPPEVMEAVQAYQDQKNAALYAGELERVKESTPEIVDELFHPFVVAAEGDFDRAAQAYKNWYGTAQQRFAPSDPTALEVPEPPATLGLPSAPAVTAPPTAKEYRGWSALDEALNDALAEMKADRAPHTVGT